MPRDREIEPKQVVYLIGAGATQAEIDHRGAQPVNLLMRDNDWAGEGLSTRILQRSGAAARPFIVENRGGDIEKLISLLSGSAVARYTDLAEKIRRVYFDEIRKSLHAARVIDMPELAVALLGMHRNATFRRDVEVLTGILTTNHDGLLQIAAQETYGALNLGFVFSSDDFTPTMSNAVPPLLQLHGSFSWRFGVPIEAARLRAGSRYSPDTVWLPPTVLKESKNYPFNRLAALSYSLLVDRCDVLRVVGASLTQNDWNILSLVFNAQRHREAMGQTAFRVELIMPPGNCRSIQEECSYLNGLTPISYLTEGRFEAYKEDSWAENSLLTNVFAYWLKEKLTYHYRRNEFGSRELRGAMATVSGEA